MNLDWQEMPGDYVNLSTQKECPVAEVRDMFNRLLLARGFTLLVNGRTLSVVNISKKLDLSLVPRVAPEELKDHQPYEFVKVSFPLERMTAESAVEELKPMKSPNGQLIPLKLTNRLEAVDAVLNLREIHALLVSEQSAAGGQRSVKEFTLQYARAEEVRDQLEALLGKEKGGGMPQMPGQGGQGMSPEMIQQLQMQQQQRNDDAPRRRKSRRRSAAGAAEQAPLAAERGVLCHQSAEEQHLGLRAPPDKMALIAQVVETLDVPAGSQTSLLANVARTKPYRLTGVEPETLVKTLREIGNLDPSTILQVDKKNKLIIVTGPLADHAIIGASSRNLAAANARFPSGICGGWRPITWPAPSNS